MVIQDVCPRCKSPKYKKNGHIHNGKQNHQCKDCSRQFVDCFEQYFVSDETRGLIERLLLERLSLRGICRAVGVGLKWLLGFLVQCIEALPDHLNVQPVSCTQDVIIQHLEVEADESDGVAPVLHEIETVSGLLPCESETTQLIERQVRDALGSDSVRRAVQPPERRIGRGE